MAYCYDHAGFRVERTAQRPSGPETTVYHVDPANPTGYAQTLEEGVDEDGDRELDPAEVDRAYTIATAILTQASSPTSTLMLLTDARGTTLGVLDLTAQPTGQPTGPLTPAAVRERHTCGWPVSTSDIATDA